MKSLVRLVGLGLGILFTSLSHAQNSSQIIALESPGVQSALTVTNCSHLSHLAPVVRVYLNLDQLKECPTAVPAQLEWIKDALDDVVWAGGVRNNIYSSNTQLVYRLYSCEPAFSNYTLLVDFKFTDEERVDGSSLFFKRTISLRDSHWDLYQGLGLGFVYSEDIKPDKFVDGVSKLTENAVALLKLANPIYPKHCANKLPPLLYKECLEYGNCEVSR